MQIDPFTALLFGLFTKVLLGALFLFFWLKDRQASWFGWWAGSLLVGAASSVIFMVWGVGPDIRSIGFGNALLILAFGCCWQGARAFDGRPALWLPLMAPPVVWLLGCLLPTAMEPENMALRVVISSLLLTPMVGLTTFEFWRGRDETLPSRWPVIILFGMFTVFFASRVVLINMLPFPFGALPMRPGWVGLFSILMSFHTSLLTVLMVALSKERLELDQRNKAQTDPLTGALNRRAFMTRGAKLTLRHQLEQRPLCLLFLDLDHFKSLNDRFGHSGGDDVLRAFVGVVHENIRPTDFLYRLGGEEFCCLLPYTGTAQAHVVAERIRHKYQVARIEAAGKPVESTVSIGIASTEIFGYDIDMLARKADMAVYAAKRQGRNRVEVATAANALDSDVVPTSRWA